MKQPLPARDISECGGRLDAIMRTLHNRATWPEPPQRKLQPVTEDDLRRALITADDLKRWLVPTGAAPVKGDPR